MKLTEIAPRGDFALSGKYDPLPALKDAILRNKQPEIADASYKMGHFSWGELEKLGYAERGSDRSGREDIEWWTYTGPNSIVLVTGTAAIAGGKTTHGQNRRVMKTGDRTDPIVVDYS